MPMKSQAQRRFLWATDPRLARRFENETPKGKKLPDKVANELTTKGRDRLDDSSFALPGRRYPIHDAAHARNALARVAQHGTPAEQEKVRAAVHRRFPDIGKTAAFDAGAADAVEKTAKGESRATKFLKGFGPEAGIGLATALGAGAGNMLAGKPVEGGAVVGGLAGGASLLHSYLKNRKRLKR